MWSVIPGSFTLKKACITIFLVLSLTLAPVLNWGETRPLSGKVTLVCDGDTIILESGERIRYLGIDAPEVAHGKDKADCFGDEARKLNTSMVLHKQVSLQYERETTDPHGRLLAYVFLPDGRSANLEMLRAGCAFVFRSSGNFKRLQEFLGVQQDSIHKRAGMWGSCPVKLAPSYIGNRQSFVLHRPECDLGKRMAARERIPFGDRWAGLREGYRPCRYCKP